MPHTIFTTTKKSTIHSWSYHETNKPTLIYIHGFTGNHTGFQYLVPLLQDFHVIIPDVPGFGESTLNHGSWSIAAIAAELNEWVASLRLQQKPFLASHSMGTLVGAAMLAQAPALYQKKTVFFSPVATPVGKFDSRTIGALAGAGQYYIGKTVPHLGPKLVKSRRLSTLATHVMATTKDKELKKAIIGHHHDNLTRISSIDFYYTLHREIVKMGVIDYADALQPFKTLLISGDKDNVTPLATIKTLQKALHAQLTIVPGVGHLAHYETPASAATAMRQFLLQ